MPVVTKRFLKPSEYHALEFWIMISEICVRHFIILSFLFEAKCEINEFNKLGLSWAKLSQSCVKLIKSFDILSHLNGLD